VAERGGENAEVAGSIPCCSLQGREAGSIPARRLTGDSSAAERPKRGDVGSNPTRRLAGGSLMGRAPDYCGVVQLVDPLAQW
jgi:hypothetical protein